MADHELNILVKAKGALQAARDIGKVDSSVGRLSSTASRGIRTAARNTAVIGAGIITGIGVGVKSGINSLAELEDATTSVTAALKNAGIQGQVSSAQVATWANDIERNVGAAFDDKDIVAATATLIRFGKVTPGNIKPAMQVITDLAVKTGSVDSAATLLAKALADPEKAAGKLARTGVILTKEQQKQITAHMKAGRVAQAQAVILGELEKTTKGAAAASQGPYRRSLAVLADVTEDAQRALGEGFLPVITKVSDLLQGELAKPSTIANIREFGKGLASGLDDLIDIARNLPWGAIGTSLQVAGAGAKTILGAFSSMPPWVQTAILTGWGLNKLTGGALGGIVGELGKGLIKGVLGMTAGVVNINAGVVNGGGGVPGVGADPTKGGGLKGLVGNVVRIALPIAAAGAAAQFVATNQAQWFNSPSSDPKTVNDNMNSGKTTFNGRVFVVNPNAVGQSVGKYVSGILPKTPRSSQDNDPDKRSWRNQTAELKRIHDMVNASKDDTVSAVGKTTAASQETKRETTRGTAIVASTTRTSAMTNAAIVAAAIRAKDLSVRNNIVVNVSASGVTSVQTSQERSGGSGSSRNTDKNAAQHV